MSCDIGERRADHFVARAESCGERAVCVILSGTATDGSIGAKAIKEAGGLVIAQDPKEAEYDGMPRSAIASGAVDLVLPLARIPEALASYAGHRYVKTGASGPTLLTGDGATKIIDLLRKKTAHDFALYKDGTVGRRIERRSERAYEEAVDRALADARRLVAQRDRRVATAVAADPAGPGGGMRIRGGDGRAA